MPFTPYRLATIALAAALVSHLAASASALRAIDDFLSDTMKSYLSPVSDVRADIAVIAITEETLDQFPYRSPVDRTFLASLLRDLDERNVKAIGLDIALDAPSDAISDQALKTTIADLRTRFIPITLGEAARSSSFEREMLTNHAAASPFLVADRHDGVVRRLGEPDDGRASLAQALAARSPSEGKLRGKRFRVFKSATGDYPFRIVPAHLLSDIPPSSNWLEGRIVLIGAITDFRDQHRTSLRFSFANSEMPGVIVQAYQLAYLLDGSPRTSEPLWLALATVLAFAGLGVWLGANTNSISHNLFLAGVAFFAPFLSSLIVFYLTGWQSRIAAPTLAFLVTFAATAGAVRIHTERSFAYISEAFGRYLDPAVAHALAQSDVNELVRPRRTEIAILFSDMNGFSRFVETHTPENVKHLMDAYLDVIASCVSRHGGIVDRFVGDGVHAFFGAPVALPDPNSAAIACAFDILEQTNALRSQFKADAINFGSTRIGLHAGEATIGDFGGTHRSDFTAHGTAVNVASRLVTLAGENDAAICATFDVLGNASQQENWALSNVKQLKSLNNEYQIYFHFA